MRAYHKKENNGSTPTRPWEVQIQHVMSIGKTRFRHTPLTTEQQALGFSSLKHTGASFGMYYCRACKASLGMYCRAWNGSFGTYWRACVRAASWSWGGCRASRGGKVSLKI